MCLLSGYYIGYNSVVNQRVTQPDVFVFLALLIRVFCSNINEI